MAFVKESVATIHALPYDQIWLVDSNLMQRLAITPRRSAS